MAIIDTVRSRIRPEWGANPDLASFRIMLENALTFVGVPKAMKERVSKSGTLNELGIAQALRGELNKAVMPELRRIRGAIAERRAEISRQRAAMAQLKVDPVDVVGAVQRQEMRTYLRSLSEGERLKVLIEDPDLRLVQAALEMPAALSGLRPDTRTRVVEAYVQATHARALKALNELEEVLELLGVAVEIVITEIRTNARMTDAEFQAWFGVADGAGKLAA